MYVHLSNSALAAAITRRSSHQTYLTIRLLVDRERVAEAFQAYAYFRWVDDHLDQPAGSQTERLAFLKRQEDLVKQCEWGQVPSNLSAEEKLLVDLLRSDPNPQSGLRAYIQNMMAVMRFDTERRGRMITQDELGTYTHWLAVAVTEALHYFIGHRCPTPHDETRYQAVTAAHIVHMLRDTFEDTCLGYYNLPREVAEAGHITPQDFHSPPYREWVRYRVSQARHLFGQGKIYLSRIQNLRCRLAGFAYIGRFECVLRSIENEGYLLRPEYPERTHLRTVLSLLTRALHQALFPPAPRRSALQP